MMSSKCPGRSNKKISLNYGKSNIRIHLKAYDNKIDLSTEEIVNTAKGLVTS